MLIEYNDKTHRYKVDGEYYPSVTTILGVIGKPGLLEWAIRNPEEFIRQQQEKAISIGKLVHEAIMKILRGEKVEFETEYPVEVKNAIEAFFKWKNDVKLEFTETEKLVASTKYKYAGKVDAIALRDSKIVLCDWKTGKAIYPEYILQVVAYKNAYEETEHKKISELYIVRFDKETGMPEVHEIMYNKKIFGVFLAVKKLYEFLKEKNKT